MLHDDVLLKIFDFHVTVDDNDMDEIFEEVKKTRIEGWITLIHVCRRWRNLVFYSPRRLNLRLVCTPKTPVRDTLDIWPPLPLIIRAGYWPWNDHSVATVDNTIAALEHNDRVCQIDLGRGPTSQLEYIANSAAMQKPFPELTRLWLYGLKVESISFLGGTTTPRLRLLYLDDVPFPAFPKLLLSATHLVHLDLDITPLYIPPEAMATSLSALTDLESLCIRFLDLLLNHTLESRRLPPPLTRSILPNLTKFEFYGPSEYLEVILVRIDSPRLNKMYTIFYREVTFDRPQFFQFISRCPMLRTLEKAQIAINYEAMIFKSSSQTTDYGDGEIRVEIRSDSSWQLSSLAQAWTSSSLPPVHTLQDLYIFEDRLYPPYRQGDVENKLWLDFLRSFVALKNLYLSEEFVTHFAPALQELVGGRTTEVLPNLENIFLEGFQSSGPLHEGIEKFVAARRLTSHPVAVSLWDEDSKQEEERQYEDDDRYSKLAIPL